jgi:phosphoribosyl-ATP pyrophosphohydrolase
MEIADLSYWICTGLRDRQVRSQGIANSLNMRSTANVSQQVRQFERELKRQAGYGIKTSRSRLTETVD